MKPNFALILGFDGIELAQRTSTGWLSVGAVAFDRPDLDAAVDALIAEARRLAPEGITTKLVVPDDEVRYAVVLAPGPTDEARRYQIEAEIDGLTPYRIDELAYDWIVEGDHAQVAVVAREILREAEEFATERGFDPVSFVARPPSGQFAGEPFFGRTGASRGLIAASDDVQPDAEPVRVVGKVPPRPAEPPPAAAVAAPAAPAPVAPKVPAPPPPVVALPVPPPAAPPAPVEAPVETAVPLAAEATRKVGDLVRRLGTRLRREQAETALAAAPPSVPAVEARSPEAPQPEVAAQPAEGAVVAFASRRVAGAGGRSLPETTGRVERPKAPPRDPRAGSGADPGGRLAILPKAPAPTPSGLSRMAERGRSAARTALAAMTARRQAEAAPPPAPVDRVVARDRGLTRRSPAETPIVASRPPSNPREKATEAEALTLFGRRGQPEPATSLAGPVLMGAGGLVALLAAVAVWALYFNPSDTAPGSLATPAETPAPVAAVAPPPPVAAPQPTPTPAPEPAATAAADPVETDPQVLAERLANEAMAEAEVGEIIDRLTPPEDAAEGAAQAPDLTPLPEEGAEPAELAAAPDAAPPQPAAIDPGVTEAITAEPEVPAELAPRAEAGTDAAPAPSAAPDRLALPGRLMVPPVSEVLPASPAPPPPFEALAAAVGGAADAAPEPEPIPEIVVTERAPAVVPPRAPGRQAPPAADPAVEPVPEAPTAEAVVVPDDTPRADPALAGARPAPRSARVQALGEAQRAAPPEPAPPAEDAPEAEPAGRLDQGSLAQPLDDVALAAEAELEPLPGGVALTMFRPQRRPTDLVPDPSAAPPVVEEPAEVVAQSLMPAQRPGNLSARVEATLAAQARERERAAQAREAAAAARQQARAAAAAAPAPAPAPTTQTAAAAPAYADEGEEAYAPGAAAPTTASVQQAATQTRAIATREANLIGVFGSPSNRRALVRTGSGQVVRLQVGDRFDGGQVSAIGDSELRYIRSGRDVVLRIAGGRG